MPADVSIVLPCLNEVRTLEQCITEAFDALEQIKRDYQLIGEVLVADNGSTDGSIELAQRLGVRVEFIPERGYGNALIGGIRAAYGTYIVMADADASYDLREAVSMIACLREGYDLCLGNRFKGTIQPGAMPRKNRTIGNPLLSRILNLLFHSKLGDVHSGMRAFTKSAFEQMRLTSTGMEFASEMVIKATLLGLKRIEVPITLRPDGRDRPPHLRPWRDGWRHLRYLMMLSPTWVYFLPALLFGLVGGVIFLLLVLSPNDLVVEVGPIWFGNHWMIISGALILAAHQATMFGLATKLYGIREGYRRVQRWQLPLFRLMTLEYAILVGLSLIAVGLMILAVIVVTWSAEGFGGLNRLRELSLASTLALMGLQHFFFGFLLAIIGGNEANIYKVVKSAK